MNYLPPPSRTGHFHDSMVLHGTQVARRVGELREEEVDDSVTVTYDPCLASRYVDQYRSAQGSG